MAFVACNRPDRAEFLIRRPTPVKDEAGKELCRVLHYAESRAMKATTQILAGEE